MSGFVVFLLIIFFAIVPMISKAKKKEQDRQRIAMQQAKKPPIRTTDNTDISKLTVLQPTAYTSPIPYTPIIPAPPAAPAAGAAASAAYAAQEMRRVDADSQSVSDARPHPHSETKGASEPAPTEAPTYLSEGCEEHYATRPAWSGVPQGTAPVSRSELMRAVVFAEVLAKPKALRRGRTGIGV